MLLYLNSNTFLGEAGAELGRELIAAKRAGGPYPSACILLLNPKPKP